MNIRNGFKVIVFAGFFCIAQGAIASFDDQVSDITVGSEGYVKSQVYLDEEDMRYVLAELQSYVAEVKEYIEQDASVDVSQKNVDPERPLMVVVSGQTGSFLAQEDRDDFVQNGLASLFCKQDLKSVQEHGLINLCVDEKVSKK